MDIKVLLKIMVQKGASDLFISAGVAPSFKLNGKLVPITKAALTPEQSHDLVLGVMDEDQRSDFGERHECNFAIEDDDVGRFRVSAFVQRGQMGMVLRRIETRIPTIDELGLPGISDELAMTQRGLIILVGATGSGKSTSLAAMVGHRNHHGTGHIITIEDPIEYVHPHDNCIVTQREVGVDTDSFEIALKNTLRQAPDVILIGEVRSRETMEYAINFAETGHLCMCTLHANNASQALDRIIHFFTEDRRQQLLMDLSLNLKAVLAQQLIPTKDGTGIRLITEVLLNTPYSAELIRKGDINKLKELMKRSNDGGMHTFDQALFWAYKEGAITEKDAIRHADSANEVRLMIKLDAGETIEEAQRTRQVKDEEGGGLSLL